MKEHSHPFVRRYMTDLNFKAEISICVSFGVTVVFCIYKAAAGIYYRSAWFGAMAFYYMVLGGARLLLLRHIRRREYDERKTLKKYRFCGCLLLVLTAALGVMSFYPIYGNEAIRYPGYMIYAAATYAFYNLIMAILNLVRYRKVRNPIYSAGKIFSLAGALVSLLFLQISLLDAFGSGEGWERYMNIGTGTVVFLAIVIMALSMIVSANRAKPVR